MSKSCGKLCVAIGLLLFLSLGGCSGDSVQSHVAAMNTSNIKRVANLFAAYQDAQGGQGPKDKEAIVAYAKTIPTDALHNMKIDENNLDALFISERDNKPLRIKFGAVRSAMSPHIPIVFEEKGVGDNRQIAWTNAQVKEVDNAEYQKLWGEKTVAAPPPGPPHGENAGSDTSKQSAAK